MKVPPLELTLLFDSTWAHCDTRGVVTLCAPRARARAVFGPDKCKDLCGHAQFLLRNVPEKDFETFELLS